MASRKAAEPFNNPFSVLRKPEAQQAPEQPPQAPSRAVLRYERKGRGGKEVTVIELPGKDTTSLSDWLRDLKAALGCGGSLQGESIMLQGDQRERARAWLTTRGVRKVAG
jgi:translation initiation factor 1